MHKDSRKRNSVIDKMSAFLLMVTVSLGTEKGRTAVSRLAAVAGKLNCAIKIGFKIILFIAVLSLLFLIKQWMT